MLLIIEKSKKSKKKHFIKYKILKKKFKYIYFSKFVQKVFFNYCFKFFKVKKKVFFKKLMYKINFSKLNNNV